MKPVRHRLSRAGAAGMCLEYCCWLPERSTYFFALGLSLFLRDISSTIIEFLTRHVNRVRGDIVLTMVSQIALRHRQLGPAVSLRHLAPGPRAVSAWRRPGYWRHWEHWWRWRLTARSAPAARNLRWRWSPSPVPTVCLLSTNAEFSRRIPIF